MLHRPRPVALKHSVKAKKPFTVNNSKPVGKEKKNSYRFAQSERTRNSRILFLKIEYVTRV